MSAFVRVYITIFKLVKIYVIYINNNINNLLLMAIANMKRGTTKRNVYLGCRKDSQQYGLSKIGETDSSQHNQFVQLSQWISQQTCATEVAVVVVQLMFLASIYRPMYLCRRLL
jgi:hypothetical protein